MLALRADWKNETCSMSAATAARVLLKHSLMPLSQGISAIRIGFLGFLHRGGGPGLRLFGLRLPDRLDPGRSSLGLDFGLKASFQGAEALV